MAQARVIAQSLAQFEALKPAYVARGKQIVALKAGQADRDVIITAKDSINASLTRTAGLEQVLRRDAEANGAIWKSKARKRGWINVVLALLVGGITYTAITR